MFLSFDSDLAVKYGLNEAIFLHNLAYWITQNQCNERACRDGRYWSYNSMRAFAEQFKFWSPRQIERIVNSCREQGAIRTAQLSKKPMDRTLWYALDGTAFAFYFGGNSHFTKQGNASHKTVDSIPPNGEIFNEQIINKNNIPPISPTGNTDAEAGKSLPEGKVDVWYTYADGNDLLLSALRDFEVMRNKVRKPMTPRSRNMLLTRLDKLSGGDAKLKIALLEQSIFHSWDSIYPLHEDDKAGQQPMKPETRELQ